MYFEVTPVAIATGRLSERNGDGYSLEETGLVLGKERSSPYISGGERVPDISSAPAASSNTGPETIPGSRRWVVNRGASPFPCEKMNANALFSPNLSMRLNNSESRSLAVSFPSSKSGSSSTSIEANVSEI